MDFRTGMRAYVRALGCRVNQSEAAMTADSLRAAGFDVVENPDGADIMVLNSCALTEFAEAKTRRAIKDFKKRNPGARVCATGCYAQTKAAELQKAGADIVVSNAEKGALAEILAGLRAGGGICADSCEAERLRLGGGLPGDRGFATTGGLSDRMSLKIQDGCDNACAYCIIPRARGLPRSRAFADILEDARRLVSRGAREIVLTGINMSKFEGSLADLCDALNAIPELERMAIGSLEPPVPELGALCVRMADPGHKLAKHFHISMQSASDRVLEAMRRKYRMPEILDALRLIRETDPSIAVGTDIICGFPGETDDDFGETLANIKSAGLAFLHVFTYSPRPKTLASLMKPPPLAVRKARADVLRKAGKGLFADFAGRMRGREVFVLLENRLKSGEYPGYSENYVPCSVRIPQDGLKNRMAKAVAGEIGADGRLACEFLNLA